MMIFNSVENSLIDCIDFIESFEVHVNGEKKLILQSDCDFNKIKSNLEGLFVQSRLMPAFGVSSHIETLNEIKQDSWIKINFNKEIIKSGLPCEALLFKLEEVQGFNLIRSYRERYDGRCLYLDLDAKIDLKNIIR